ncbi:hypothetical protein GDO78_016286 [Eleutherodactylus coqui]|uniref:Uncharacterized protein n=1 Tax=Eleutherodactylus coqui TaxID=57060 RepID=A0A8J6EAM5_ELECQ|nr:hypothetical protein GDO78_016286 [Eleutherodactylus coqui]
MTSMRYVNWTDCNTRDNLWTSIALFLEETGHVFLIAPSVHYRQAWYLDHLPHNPHLTWMSFMKRIWKHHPHHLNFMTFLRYENWTELQYQRQPIDKCGAVSVHYRQAWYVEHLPHNHHLTWMTSLRTQT